LTEKRKVTITVDDELWRKWVIFVVNKTGSLKAVSEYTEKAIREYMEKHGGEEAKGGHGDRG